MLAFSPDAFLFDLNGTMIDDMHFHLKVWYSILNDDLHANLSIDEVRRQMYGKNHELLERVFGSNHFTSAEADRISKLKEDRYQHAYKPHLKLLPGLETLFQMAVKADIKMAIASAAIPYNIDFVLDNLNIRHFFAGIVSADDVKKSKPDPETFLKAAALLNVDPAACVVFEDAPKGVEAADRAGMKSVVVTTMHEPEEFHASTNVLMFIKDYNDPRFSSLVTRKKGR
jgi:beta-phosphoglucomutase